MENLTIKGLKDQLTANAYENVFFVKASQAFENALNSKFDNKAELSDWVNEKLDSDDFDIDADIFTDNVNDIINVIAEFYNLS